jgi:tetratricopeptide (TPR) repeat protein
VEYLDRSNQKAIKVSAMEDAMAYFDEAMKLLDTLPETAENRKRQISLLLNQWVVFHLLFKLPEYHDLLTRYRPMAIELDNPGLLGAFYARIGTCEWTSGYTERAIQTTTKAAELCEAAGNAEGARFAYFVLAWCHLYKANYDKVITSKEDALRKLEQQFNLRIYVFAMCPASRAYAYLGRFDQALKDGKAALKVAEEYSDDSLISFAAMIISWICIVKGDLDSAIEYGDLAVQKAHTPADRAWAQGILAWAWCRSGEPNRGIESLTATLPIQRASRYRPTEIHFMLILGEGYWLAGEYDKARQTLEEVLQLAERCEFRFHRAWAQRLLGEIAADTNPSQAAFCFEKAIALFHEIKSENELALTYAGYGRFHEHQGNIEKAREYLTNALEIFERLGTLIEPDKVRRELAELSKE